MHNLEGKRYLLDLARSLPSTICVLDPSMTGFRDQRGRRHLRPSRLSWTLDLSCSLRLDAVATWYRYPPSCSITAETMVDGSRPSQAKGCVSNPCPPWKWVSRDDAEEQSTSSPSHKHQQPLPHLHTCCPHHLSLISLTSYSHPEPPADLLIVFIHAAYRDACAF